MRIEDFAFVSENREGKAKIEFDPSYPFISETDRKLFSSSLCISKYDFTIMLPRPYDETVLSFFPPYLDKNNDYTFALSSSK